jgi:hypothetical protein
VGELQRALQNMAGLALQDKHHRGAAATTKLPGYVQLPGKDSRLSRVRLLHVENLSTIYGIKDETKQFEFSSFVAHIEVVDLQLSCYKQYCCDLTQLALKD